MVKMFFLQTTQFWVLDFRCSLSNLWHVFHFAMSYCHPYSLSVRWAFPSKTWKRCAVWVHPPRDWGRQVTKAWASKPASYSQHDHMSCLRITSFSLMRRECEMNAEGICEVMSELNRIFVRNCPEPLIRRTIARYSQRVQRHP